MLRSNLLALFILGVTIVGCAPNTSSESSGAPPPEKNSSIPPSTSIDKTSRPWDQWGTRNPSWVKNIAPFSILGNVHHVGTSGLNSFLITTEDGHILLDGNLPQSAGDIAANIKTLGFDIADVKILLNSHAHFDHSGGLARLKELSDAQLISSQGDVSALEGGFYLGAEDNENYAAPPVKVDRIVKDGEQVTLGGTTLTANITPGHTRGCTSWSMTITADNIPYETLFFCSATVAGNSLNPPQYDGIVEDYKHTFETTRNWTPDIFLAHHSIFFDLHKKRKAQLEGNPLAFVDRKKFPRLIRRMERDFILALNKAYATEGSEKQD